MPYRACLVDVYETVVSIDLPRYGGLLAELAEVDVRAFAEALAQWSGPAMDGTVTLEQTFREVLLACGAGDDTAVGRLLAADRRLVREHAVLHDDAIPFLRSLRTRGVRTAFVSNCAENTRPLLDGLGLSELVDELVLSCEVRAAKPSPAIFEIALDRLGVSAGEALFVDDQQAFCDAAAGLGIRGVRIDRTSAGPDGPDGPDGVDGVVTSLAELAAYFSDP